MRRIKRVMVEVAMWSSFLVVATMAIYMVAFVMEMLCRAVCGVS